MNEYEARKVEKFIEILFGDKLLNLWIEPSDSIISDGWVVFFNFDRKKDYYIQSVAEMRAPEFWEKLLTKANEAV